MSRTYKDKPSKFAHPEGRYDFGTERLAYETERILYDYDLETRCYAPTGEIETCVRFFWLQAAGAKTKKKKRVDTEWHWMTTPGWFIKEFMNQPQRARGRMWEKRVNKTNIEDLDLLDLPDVSRKPHLYYW